MFFNVFICTIIQRYKSYHKLFNDGDGYTPHPIVCLDMKGWGRGRRGCQLKIGFVERTSRLMNHDSSHDHQISNFVFHNAHFTILPKSQESQSSVVSTHVY